MPYLIVKGTFHIIGKQPDGDTIAFRPENPEKWLKKAGMRIPDINKAGDVSLRFEAIDAPETHYKVPSWLPETSQPAIWANESRDRMLSLVGIPPEEVVWKGDEVKEAPDGTPGHIATNGVDPFGRVIAFIYAGDPPEKWQTKKDEFYLNSDDVLRSINYKLIEKGLVYPTFYSGLYPTLRNVIAKAVKEARKKDLGLWSHDVSSKGVAIPNPDDLSPITQDHVIFPKLFRRLSTHFLQNGAVRNFKGFLYSNPDAVIKISNCEMATLGRFISVDKKQAIVKLRTTPENLMFVPR